MIQSTTPIGIEETPSSGVNPSGHTDPVWYTDARPPEYSALRSSRRTDVCVVGAGIAGLTTAYILAKAGRSVLVLDEKPVGGGESGRTSAHLTSAIDNRFFEIERIHGQDGAAIQYESHAAAIDWIENLCLEEMISCDFSRVDGYLLLDESHKAELLEQELEAARRAGVAGVQRLGVPPLQGYRGGRPCLRFPDQARFHATKYLTGLAEAVLRAGGEICCGTRVMDMSGGESALIKTQAGHTVTADACVAATNVPSPINNWIGIYTKQAPYRTYVVGLLIKKGAIADALYWDTLDPYHYVRLEMSAGDNEHDILLVGGEDHKTGQHKNVEDELERFDRLEAWARKNFGGTGKRMYSWSGQINEPADGVAFIGRVPTRHHENCYVITGDSGQGLTHGTLGGILVSDLILGRPNPWEELYDPARKSLKSADDFVQENVNMAAQYKDYLTPGEVSSSEDVQPGHGALVRRGLSKVAVYRDECGNTHECSAVCPHLGGIVHWNDVEKTWDCPLHGSRFDAEGKLIIGPAVDELKQVEHHQTVS